MQSIYNYFFLTKLSKVISFYEIALHKFQYRLEPESHPRALPDQNIEWHHQVTTTTKFESEGLYRIIPDSTDLPCKKNHLFLSFTQKNRMCSWLEHQIDRNISSLPFRSRFSPPTLLPILSALSFPKSADSAEDAGRRPKTTQDQTFSGRARLLAIFATCLSNTFQSN